MTFKEILSLVDETKNRCGHYTVEEDVEVIKDIIVPKSAIPYFKNRAGDSWQVTILKEFPKESNESDNLVNISISRKE